MPQQLPQKWQSFTAFTSARDERCIPPEGIEVGRGSEFSSERSRTNVTSSEATALERRVLAHERILRALIGHLAENDEDILVQLKSRFGNGQALGGCEQNYLSTDHFGDHFIRSIEAEVRRRKYEAR